MNEVAVAVEIAADASFAVDADLIARAAQEAVTVGVDNAPDPGTGAAVRAHSRLEMSVLVTNEEEIQGLNRKYRLIDRPTDVLSFALLEGGTVAGHPSDLPLPLGDVVLCDSIIERQARDLGHSVAREVAWLTIHGTLQLLGYAHAEEEGARRMEFLEQTALARLGDL